MSNPTTIEEGLRQSQEEGIAGSMAMFATKPGSKEDKAEFRLMSFIENWEIEDWHEKQVSPASLYEMLEIGRTPAEFQANLNRVANLRRILNGVARKAAA